MDYLIENDGLLFTTAFVFERSVGNYVGEGTPSPGFPMDSTAIAKEDEEFAGFLSDRPEFQRGISSTPGQHGPVGSISKWPEDFLQ